MKNTFTQLLASLFSCLLTQVTMAQGDNPYNPSITSISKHQVVNCLQTPEPIGVIIAPFHPGYQYNWSTGEVDSIIYVNPQTSAAYAVTISNSEIGINTVKHFSVDILNEPIVIGNSHYEIDKQTCKGTPIEIEPSFDGGHAPYSLVWADLSTARTKTVKPFESEDYSVTITDACGTQAIAPIIIEVEKHDPLIFSSNVVITFACDDEIITLSPSLEGISGGVGHGYQYTFDDWSRADMPQEIAAKDGLEITYTVTDACQDEFIKSNIVLQKETIELPTANPMTVCEGEVVEITEQSDLGRLYYWNGNEMLVDFQDEILETKEYNLTYVDQCGDGHIVPKQIVVSEVTSDFEYDVHAVRNEVVLTASEAQTQNKYSWIINGVEYSNESSYLASLEVGTVNEVTLITENDLGCKTSETKSITVRDNLSIPTAFSPNQDGRNDYFFIATDEPFLSFSIEIFDRWGQRIFHSSDQYLKWGGDSTIPNGLNTYVYVVKGVTVSGGLINETGTLTVMN